MRNDLDFDDYKKRLERRLIAIQQERGAQEKELAPVELDQAKVGRLSRMDAIQQQAMAQATSRRAEYELIRIKTALENLQSGDYGCCVICDEYISEGRLQADPASLVCIDCARDAEKR